jgi:hypothetical protein
MLDDLVTATWFEGIYQETLRKAARSGLPAISRTVFWLLVMRQIGLTPSEQVLQALLHLGPEVEQMMAAARILLRRSQMTDRTT